MRPIAAKKVRCCTEWVHSYSRGSCMDQPKVSDLTKRVNKNWCSMCIVDLICDGITFHSFKCILHSYNIISAGFELSPDCRHCSLNKYHHQFHYFQHFITVTVTSTYAQKSRCKHEDSKHFRSTDLITHPWLKVVTFSWKPKVHYGILQILASVLFHQQQFMFYSKLISMKEQLAAATDGPFRGAVSCPFCGTLNWTQCAINPLRPWQNI